jgi:putative FmdB family regulatory protein
MPVYEYRCKACGATHEITHGFNAERPTKCPTCGAEQLVRVFHPVGVVFKGSGFHKTDYAGAGTKKATSDSSKGDATTSSGDSGKSESGTKADSGAKADAGKSDSKPAAAAKDAKPKKEAS